MCNADEMETIVLPTGCTIQHTSHHIADDGSIVMDITVIPPAVKTWNVDITVKIPKPIHETITEALDALEMSE